jgi:glycerol-3-phosphate acyltransferase PlsX
MAKKVTIALDAMGGDIGPDAVVPAAVKVLKRFSDLNIILVGNEDELGQKINQYNGQLNDTLHVHHASEVVGMDELPSVALRKKKDSSMRVAIDLVKEKRADACVSAGNTGALMATSRFVLKMLPGIDRPAIISHLPSLNGHTYMLDLGANVDSTAEHLRDFAVMGAELAKAVENIENPKVALLNVGEEEIKGNEQVKKAAALLAASDLNYVGYAEGDDVFIGDLDVIVCDGFVGNVALKSSEGVAKMITHTMRTAFKSNLYSMLIALLAAPILRTFKRTFDPGRYNGASLLGLRGIVIKSHGGADADAFANAIEIAIREVEKQVPEAICSHLEAILQQSKSIEEQG